VSDVSTFKVEVIAVFNIIQENLPIDINFCGDANVFSCDYHRMDIHQRIKQRRMALGMTMKDLAELCGAKSYQTVQLWEKREGTAPTRQRLPNVAKALKTTESWLLTGEENDALGDKRREWLDLLEDLSTEDIMEFAALIKKRQDRNRAFLREHEAINGRVRPGKLLAPADVASNNNEEELALIKLFRSANEKQRDYIKTTMQIASESARSQPQGLDLIDPLTREKSA
jgi:transcriptional regulator with XRE-family HTH domain